MLSKVGNLFSSTVGLRAVMKPYWRSSGFSRLYILSPIHWYTKVLLVCFPFSQAGASEENALVLYPRGKAIGDSLASHGEGLSFLTRNCSSEHLTTDSTCTKDESTSSGYTYRHTRQYHLIQHITRRTYMHTQRTVQHTRTT